MRAVFRAALAALLIVVAGSLATAEPAPQADPAAASRTLRVATRVIPPLVIEDNGKLTGFSIELWNGIAERLKLATTLVTMPDVKSLLEAVRTGESDLAISAISITADREREFDFSLPMLDAGLQILVRGSDGGGTANPLEGILRLLLSPTLLVWLAIAAVLVIVPAHVIWFIERGHPEGIIPGKAYIPGIFHAIWWATSTLATQAEQMPRHWLARILAVLWMFVGVIFVAYYTAQLTASLTVQEIRGAISGPADLPGKKVATTRGSTAAAFVRKEKAQVIEFAQISDAYAALAAGTADAVVFDAPVLQHYAAHDGKGKVRVVGPVFRKEDYGIAFKPGNQLRREINAALLTMKEDGSYQALHDKWFKGD
ncbi:MAG: transporter substrate-binding domain-containing protein [Hyphomicrobium sp.]|jgi:polar amino acid transport system substrate-binding protein